VITLSQHSHHPAQIHYEAAKQVFAYLNAAKKDGLTAFLLWPSYNGHFWGVYFLKGHISLKNWPKRLLLRHDTTSFKHTCLFIYLIEAKAALCGLHLHCELGQ
jgi:hypothetical protein